VTFTGGPDPRDPDGPETPARPAKAAAKDLAAQIGL